MTATLPHPSTETVNAIATRMMMDSDGRDGLAGMDAVQQLAVRQVALDLALAASRPLALDVLMWATTECGEDIVVEMFLAGLIERLTS
jgi:hypothetical protein